MKRYLAVAITIVLALFAFGCSPSEASQSAPAPSSSLPSMTDEEKYQVADYIQSSEIKGAFETSESFSSDISKLLENNDAAELDRRFTRLAQLSVDLDSMEVPAVCETLHYNVRQMIRSEALAISSFSSAAKATSMSEKAEKAKEGNGYLDLCKEFINGYAEEVGRLTELAKQA